MKFEKIFYVILSAVLIAVFILISYFIPPFSSGEESNPLEKKIFFADNISASHQKVINLFNERHKGRIKVEVINLPFDKFSTNERKELLARYLRSKSDRIDVFSVDQIWVPRFARWSVPLDKFIPEEQKNSILNYAMQSCVYDGHAVAVPLYIDIALMYCREDLIRKLPDYKSVKNKIEASITWDDFINLSRREELKGYPFFIFQADDFEGVICIFSELMSSLGKSFYQDNTLQLNTPEAEKALQLLVDMVNSYNISPDVVINFKENPSYRYYLQNNGLFLRGWPSFLSEMAKDSIENKEIFHNIMKIPSPHFAGSDPVSVYGGWNLMISKYSVNIPEAVRFISFLLSEESQKIMFEEGTYLPVNNKLYSDQVYIKDHPDLSFYKSLLDRGVHRPFVEEYTNISDVLSYYINLAIRKKLTVKEALEKASEKIKAGGVIIK